MSARRLHSAYNVSTNRWLLQRYAYVEERLMTTLAGWIWDAAALEQKIELGRFCYVDALHADALRRRVGELAPPTEEPPRSSELASLEAFCNEVANAAEPVERIVGVFRVVKPHLLLAYRQHLAETDEVTDAPTADVLQRLVEEEEGQIAWGERILADTATTPALRERAAAWEHHLQIALAAIGGVRGEPAAVVPPTLRRPEPPARLIDRPPARDDRFRVIPLSDYLVPSMGERPDEILRHLLYTNAYGEMEAEDLLGRVLADAPELPWAMRLDLARQLWDEARHVELSWRRMMELGGMPDPAPPIPAYVIAPLADLTDPLERLLVLQRVIEGRAAERHRYRVTYIGRELGDPVTARLFEYIVADERAHVGYSEWILQIVGDDRERLARLEQVQARAEQIWEDYLSRRADVTAGVRQIRVGR